MAAETWRTVGKRIAWLAVAAVTYVYLLRLPIDHFWAWSSLIPFYIKIVYDGPVEESKGAFADAMARLTAANSIVIFLLVIVLALLSLVPGAVPVALAAALVSDVCAYASGKISRAIVRAGSWIPEALR